METIYDTWWSVAPFQKDGRREKYRQRKGERGRAVAGSGEMFARERTIARQLVVGAAG